MMFRNYNVFYNIKADSLDGCILCISEQEYQIENGL